MTADPLAEQRDGFRFRGGHRALDLAATLAARRKPVPRELLDGPGDLDRWLRAAEFTPLPGAGAVDLASARQLREAIYAVAIARIAGAAEPEEALGALNVAAAQPAAAPQLEGNGLVWRGSAAALLATVAREAVTLFGGAQAGRIRQCEGEGCAILFLDTSRSGDRRWCSMAGCGNKAKVAEFRRRKRAAEA